MTDCLEKTTSKQMVTDLTKGGTLKVILLFALPLFASNIFQQFYNLADMSIIGHALGDDAVSAIGAVSIISGLFLSLCFGMTNGFAVVIAKFFGASDEVGLRKAVGNVIVISALWGVAMTVAGLLTLKPLMRYINTPDNLFDSAYSYIVIIIGFIALSLIYNVEAGILRALGNSKAPLVFLIISTFVNVGLDLLFVYVFRKGLAGAAEATVISQMISCILCFVYIVLKMPILHISLSDLKPDGEMMRELFFSGITFALMYTIVNIGTFILQGAINPLGESIIAAHTTARKISELCMMPQMTLASTMATFAGQNRGAGEFGRIYKGLKKTLLFSFGFTIFLILGIYIFGSKLVIMVSGTSNPEIINTAIRYLRFDLPFYFVLNVICITRTTLQGLGAKTTPLVASIAELVGKIITAKLLVDTLGYFGIIICEPIIWTICAAFIIIVFYKNPDIRRARKASKDKVML